MKEICVPIPEITEKEIAEVLVMIKGRKIKYNFRVESFPWKADIELTGLYNEPSLSLARIHKLRKNIENYDKEWELVQIYTPAEDDNHIHVLYRKKSK